MPDTPDLDALTAELTGPLFVPGEPGYYEERATFNLNTALHPAVIVGAASVADVRAAVRFAAAHGLAVATRGGGHLQPRDGRGQLLLTLDRMTTVTVDAPAASARITGTPRWQHVVDAAAPYGLAPMNGSSPSVGVVGYLLGGGTSPVLGRLHGYASDRITALEVVTADATVRRVIPGDDLFFALRGSRGNLGVVTAVEFGLFPIATVYAGGLWFAGERIAEVLPAWRDWARTLPDAATTSIGIQRLPELPDLPGPLRGAFVLHVRYSYAGSATEGERLLTPMRALWETVFDTVAEMPYADSGTIHHDPPDPLPYSDRSLGLRDLPDEALDTLIELTGPASDCPLANVEIRLLGGALDRPPAHPDAVPSRGLPFQWFAFGVGGPDRAPRMTDYLETVKKALTPWSDPRTMVNFLSPQEGLTPAELRDVYGPELYGRVLAVKEKYDPGNMFRVNHNITRG